MVVAQLAVTAVQFLAVGPVNDPGVASPVSGGIIAFGQLSSRPDQAGKGERAPLRSLGGATVAALAIRTLNRSSALHRRSP
jgi:hypothetical protein